MTGATSPRTPGQVLLDSSALLAFCLDEVGSDAVARALEEAIPLMTATNVAECVSKLVQRGWHPDEVEALLRELDVTVITEDLALGVLAGEVHARTRAHGVSIGDARCLAAALRDQVPVLTADRAWGALDLGIAVEVVR
ncbi:MAG: type II toxin-antitoxin system VapC family toxin [Gemmatimonadetes bacterium]|nr:type II toxin-antitoxin system VapC family toxin [Gemmatimonadota bacterium]